jgi:hypothetical protein
VKGVTPVGCPVSMRRRCAHQRDRGWLAALKGPFVIGKRLSRPSQTRSMAGGSSRYDEKSGQRFRSVQEQNLTHSPILRIVRHIVSPDHLGREAASLVPTPVPVRLIEQVVEDR